jgi:hypothetical protein
LTGDLGASVRQRLATRPVLKNGFAQLCDVESEPDGIEFDSKSVKVARIKKEADYEGVQVHIRAVHCSCSHPDANRYRFR